MLLAFGDNDIVLGGSAYLFEQKCPGVKKSIILKGVGHFSQDSGGKELVKEMIELVKCIHYCPQQECRNCNVETLYDRSIACFSM